MTPLLPHILIRLLLLSNSRALILFHFFMQTIILVELDMLFSLSLAMKLAGLDWVCFVEWIKSSRIILWWKLILWFIYLMFGWFFRLGTEYVDTVILNPFHQFLFRNLCLFFRGFKIFLFKIALLFNLFNPDSALNSVKFPFQGIKWWWICHILISITFL